MNRTAARRVISSYIEAPAARLLVRLSVSPNAITVAGLALAGGSAYLLSQGYLWGGGVVLVAAGLLDLLDGAVARATDRASPFGALLDSTVDRLSEASVFLGLLILYLRRSEIEGAILVYLALVGSLMVSYLRARSEGLGIEANVGIMTRPERVAVLAVGLVVGHWWPTAVLVVLASIAALTLLTTAQRLAHGRRNLGP